MTNRELLNKYNTLVAKCKDMEEQMKIKDEQWKAVQSENKIFSDAARSLCEMILAKDKSEMTLGKDSGTWRSLSNQKLVAKASESYKAYNKKRSASLQQLLDIAEERQSLIEGYKDQIEFYKNQLEGNDNSDGTYEEYKKKESDEKAKDNLDSDVKKNIQENNVTVIVADASGEDQSLLDLINADETVQATNLSIPINEPKSKTAAIRDKKAKDKVIKKHMIEIDLAGVVKNLSDIERDFIEVMGSTGVSKAPDVIGAVAGKDKYKNTSANTLKSKCNAAIKEMTKKEIILTTSVSQPIVPTHFSVLELSQIGLQIYKLIFETNSVQSEATIIRAEHDNLNHGYGIKCIYDLMTGSDLYTNVDMNCRKNPLVVDPQKNNKVTYIPDVFAVYKRSNEKVYIEYERGNTNRDDMIAKCNKMIHFTNNLYFLVDNKDSMEKLITTIKAWKEVTIKKRLNARVYISTVNKFRENHCDVKQKWPVMFVPDQVDPKRLDK